MKKTLLALATGLMLATPAIAELDHEKSDQAAAREALARRQILPISRVLEIATARVPGDIIKVKLERESWGFKYEIKVLATNGRVREVEIDARTGKVIEIEDD